MGAAFGADCQQFGHHFTTEHAKGEQIVLQGTANAFLTTVL